MSILKVANVHFDSAGTNRIDYLGDDKIRITSANGTVLEGATNDALLRITQTGTGDALRVEDSANPDATPFVVTATGNVGIGISSPTTKLQVVSEIAGLTAFGAVGQGGGQLTIDFSGASQNYYDANLHIFRAGILAGSSERLRIDTSGNVLIGRTDSTVGQNVKLDVNGAINCSNIFVNGNAVSGGGASITVTDQSSVNPLQYLTFTTTTTGTASSLNVATTKLTFNVATGTLSSTIFNSTSDINKKTNVRVLDNSLAILNSLNGYRFDWKDNGMPSLGVVAQEVQYVLPELIGEDNSVNYNGLIAVLIEAVKELKAELAELKSR